MPIANIQDAHEVERGLQTILTAPDADGRAREIRKLFVETLDFDHADLLVALGAAKDPNLPPDSRLLARRGGLSVLYIPLEQADDNRVKTTTASAAAKVIGDQIAEEPLLLFTNRDCDELHIIYPDLSGSRPRLQRMVAHRGQPGRTVVQQIANLWHDYGVSGKTMGEAVRNAFSVQPVTDAFFRDYKAAYDAAVSLIAANIERVYAEQFTQTLFNRLLFVHFVSRKGWLKLNGDTDYLNALWQDYKASPSSTNFYRERLRTLFFDGLNNPQSPDPTSRVQPLIGEVPFLNGGLFEETDLDRRAVDAVPDDAIVPLLTDLFNHYNFTVMEATPLDTEVAVDPEMLGKLFEETVNERNSNGAYYTPRPVVSFMCREAIKGYLSGRNIRVFQFSEEALDWGYEHDGTSAKPARRPGFGAGPPGIAGTASSSAGHPDAGRLRHALRGPQPLRDSSMGPPARCRHGAGHGFHPAQDASGGQPPYRIPSAGRGRLRDRSGRVEPGGTAGGERHCGGRQSLAGDPRPRVARGAPGGRICSRIQPGGRAKGGWGRYRGN